MDKLNKIENMEQTKPVWSMFGELRQRMDLLEKLPANSKSVLPSGLAAKIADQVENTLDEWGKSAATQPHPPLVRRRAA